MSNMTANQIQLEIADAGLIFRNSLPPVYARSISAMRLGTAQLSMDYGIATGAANLPSFFSPRLLE